MALLKKVGNLGLRAAWSQAHKQGLNCHHCGAHLELPQQFPEDGVDFKIQCPQCGESDTLGELALSQSSGESESRAINHFDLNASAGKDPVRRQQRDDGTRMWLIPKTGKSKIGSFAWIWCLFITVFSAIWIPASITSAFNEGNPWQALMALFVLPFIAIGVFLMRSHLREAKSDHLIEINEQEIRLTRRLFNKASKPKIIPLSELKSISLEVFYSVNYQPVHGITIRGQSNKIRLGASLENPVQRRLAAEWLQAAGRLEAPSPQADEPLAAASNLAQLGDYRSKKLEIKAVGDQGFRARWRPSGGIFTLTFGIFFTGVGLFLLGSCLAWWGDIGPQAPGGEKYFLLLFSLPFSLVGLIAAVYGFRLANTRHHAEFHRAGVNWTTSQFNQSKKDRFTPEQIGNLRRRQSGNAGSQLRYSLALEIDGKNRKLLHWATPEDTQAFQERLDAWLGGLKENP